MTKNRDVAEAFANGSTKAKTERVFIDGDTIYSYGRHFAMAKKIGNSIVLFNSLGYSSSTSKHKSYTRCALERKGFKIIQVPDCDLANAEKQYNMNTEQIKFILDKLTRVRTERIKEVYLEELKELKEQNDYLKDYAMSEAI